MKTKKMEKFSRIFLFPFSFLVFQFSGDDCSGGLKAVGN